MELREFLKLFKKYKFTFGAVLLLAVLVGFFWHSYQSKFYVGSMAVNISREGDLEKDSQQYDHFYRLQADEKFGKNIINWIQDPGFVNNIRKDFIGEDGDWGKIKQIKAVQLSSSYLKINFKTEDPQSAVLLGKVLEKNLKTKNQGLNSGENQNWFKLMIDQAHVTKNVFNLYAVLLVATFLGLLFGILGVLLRHYFNSSANENRN